MMLLSILQTMNEAKAEIERERDEKDSVIEKMNQAAKDKEVEHRISSKKGDQLVSVIACCLRSFLKENLWCVLCFRSLQ